MQAILCDGCGRKFTPEDFNALNELRNKIIQDPAAAPFAGVAVDDFCTSCIPHAIMYWGEKSGVTTKAAEQFNASIKNHRIQFFNSKRTPNLKVIK